jgi:predicted transcriptional regulator
LHGAIVVATQPQPASEAELAILQMLWDEGPMTSRAIRDALYSAATASRHGTVQKLLQRLEEKRLIERDRSEFVHVFRAAVTRSAYAGRQLESLAEKLTDGSLVPFLTHLVEARRLSARERKAIRDLLDAADSDH